MTILIFIEGSIKINKLKDMDYRIGPNDVYSWNDISESLSCCILHFYAQIIEMAKQQKRKRGKKK